MSTMASRFSCFAAFLLIALGCVNAQSDVTTTTAIFVFGDSYADTGNSPKVDADGNPIVSWNWPYGETSPGWPTGRFSDGKILPDYIASMIGIETPVPYTNWSSGSLDCSDFSSGVNFAHGGTGVFSTISAPDGPTLSDQIGQFETMSSACPNIKSLVDSSIALVGMVGNDYIKFIQDHKDYYWQILLPLFVPRVVQSITDSIEKLHAMGFRKFAIANIQPAGCIPFFAAEANKCDDAVNFLSRLHNFLLFWKIAALHATLPEAQIIILDQYTSFTNALDGPFVDNNFKECYNVTQAIHDPSTLPCSDPENYFFWDGLHPTHAGWEAVSNMYIEDVKKLAGLSIGQPVGFE